MTFISGSEPVVSVSGRSALVTGSTSGIGAAVARSLAARGVQVVVSGRDSTRGRQVVDDIAAAGGKAEFAVVDLAGTYTELRDFAALACELVGGQLDILVNNAGLYPVSATEELADADLDAMLAVNIRAPHVLAAFYAPAMAERGSGVIVNIGSWMARVGTPYGAMYTASKAAAEQLTRNWAAEYGPRGVRVNTVAPGVTLTPGNEAFRNLVDAMTMTTPAGIPMRPDDIAAAVDFLASDQATMIHGTILSVDGGIDSTRLT
ncbi:MAG TPA: SDR family oxidoreductase [Acidimicrobiales bacterium]|jgi:NAD(P)-dependent dehydrogenase (short-subunit alcohol dehydrogenase family)|nr:SDR family oxidoreductase [Acidimicrobiales bacterium]